MTHDDAANEWRSLGAGSLSFDRVANLYDSTRGYTAEVSAAIAEGIMRHGPLAPGAAALEIGSGTGRITLPLLERGANITGVDISERMTERLRAKYDAERAARPGQPWGQLVTRLADSVRLPFPNASFDAVIVVHVLHLITNWREALDEAQRTLRPGAPLLLGQDMTHGAQVSHPLQDKWIEITSDLGYAPRRLGAPGFTDILAEARRRGLTVEEWTIAEWTATHTIEDGFSAVADRTWSLTWQAPDDIFAESVRRLEVWARARYGDEWTTPIASAFSFRLARATAPSF